MLTAFLQSGLADARKRGQERGAQVGKESDQRAVADIRYEDILDYAEHFQKSQLNEETHLYI